MRRKNPKSKMGGKHFHNKRPTETGHVKRDASVTETPLFPAACLSARSGRDISPSRGN